ncbi:MAG: hypothetical protein ACOCT7_01235 [Candidatus Saliniplasma sp.]
MDKKIIVILLGVILIVAGIAAMAYTEPAGGPGSEASWGIADISEDTHPYFWHGVIIVLIGIILLAVAVLKMV